MIRLEGMKKEYTGHFEKLANSALCQYPLKFDRLVFSGFYTNCILLAEGEGRRFALRISSPGWRTYTDLNSEAIWLHDLAEGSDIGAAEPIASLDGKYLTAASYPGSVTYHCLLMKWLDGSKFWENINSSNIYKMGELFAKLHLFSENYIPPEGFTTRKMNEVFAREEDVALYREEYRDAYGPGEFAVICEVKQRTDEAYKRLYAGSDDPMVISHDLHHENIIIDESGRLRPFDFEDTCLGYPVQDIAMAMRDLMEEYPEDFERYLDDFRKGYEILRKFPEKYENQIDEFMSGRMLWVANWTLMNEKENFSRHLKWAVPRLEGFLKTGRLRY